MKKVVLLALATVALLATGCKSKKVVTPNQGEVEVTVLCSEFKTDKSAIRSSASAVSPNMQNAKDKALAAARRELATSVSTTLNRVVETFSSSYDQEAAASFEARTKDLAQQVTSQTINGSIVECDKITKTVNKDGSVVYRSYVAVALGSDKIMDIVERQFKTNVTEEEKLHTDFEYEQFKDTYYKALEAYGK